MGLIGNILGIIMFLFLISIVLIVGLSYKLIDDDEFREDVFDKSFEWTCKQRFGGDNYTIESIADVEHLRECVLKGYINSTRLR